MTARALPPEALTPTASSALVIQVPYRRVTEDEPVPQPLGVPDLPHGIEYDRWVGLVRAAPRSTFADSLDLLDIDDE